MQQITLHITIYDVALFSAMCVGITVALLLLKKTANQLANRFLAMALAVAVLWVAQLLATNAHLPNNILYWKYLPLQGSMALGPLLYFYVRSITSGQYGFRLKDMLHFIPLVPEVVFHALGAFIGFKIYNTPLFNFAGSVLPLTAFISVSIYLVLARRLIRDSYSRQQFNGSDRYRHGLQWLLRSISSFGFLWLLWLPVVVAAYLYPATGMPLQYGLYLLLLSALIWLGAKALLNSDSGQTHYAGHIIKPLLPEQLKQKGSWVKKMVKQNRYYQDPELSLNTLAEKLQLQPHELSRVINTALKKSFSDFVNEYRVQAAMAKMRDPAYDQFTLLGIAFESGFNSKTTFNRFFRQVAGISPVEYKSRLKNERPPYNMGRRHQFSGLISSPETTVKWAVDKPTRNYMIKNYFKIAWRNLTRHKSYTALNVAGLAVGVAVCIGIFIIIQFQTSFDGYHAKSSRIYRVLTKWDNTTGANAAYGKNVPFALPEGLRTSFTQLDQVAPVYASHNDELQVLDANGSPVKKFKETSGVFYTSPSFFKIFDFPLLAGSYESLTAPNNVLLTKEIAETYFGDWKTAVGKTIKITGYYSIGAGLFQYPAVTLKVSGILATIPANTDFQFKLVIAYGTDFTGDRQYGFQQPGQNLTAADFGCYVLLPESLSPQNFNQQLGAYASRANSSDKKASYMVQPLSDVHYDAEAGNFSNKTISHQLINVLWLIAAFILLIACVNFVNLTTAQAVGRAKEVGVRKVLGGTKAQLQIQFIIETLLIVACAVIVAAAFTYLALPYVNAMLDLPLSFSLVKSPVIVLFLLLITIVVTALAGFYPSVVLSRFNPISALKSKLTVNAVAGISLRKGLVVVQFIIAQGLIAGTLIIVKQMDYFMNRPLGFDKEAIVNIAYRPDSTGGKLTDYLKQQLLTNGAQSVTFNSNSPIEDNNNVFTAFKFDNSIKDADFEAITRFADNDYVPTYKLQMVAGRNLQPSGWTREFLVNESFVKSLGLKRPEDILNKEISIMGGLIKCPVVGVLKDFNDRSLRQSLSPLLISTNSTMYRQASVKLTTTNISSAMASIKTLWEKTFPNLVYEYHFLDERIGSFYKQENQLAALYKFFAGVAIFLSCLGLYGLASFMAAQRVKEVGIRKVLGATSSNIVYLFIKEFALLIAIAFVIATPIAWFYMHQWLQGYAYRINISVWLFGAGGLITIIIALSTISFQAIRAALANPVKSLRSE